MPAGSSYPTRPELTETVMVRGSPLSNHDIFVGAGCQQGYLHISTALQLAQNLLEAVLESDSSSSYLCEITSHSTGKVFTFRGVTTISVVNEEVSAHGQANQLITGPHRASEFKFRFLPDTQTIQALNLINKLREVNLSDNQTGEPEPPS